MLGALAAVGRSALARPAAHIAIEGPPWWRNVTAIPPWAAVSFSGHYTQCHGVPQSKNDADASLWRRQDVRLDGGMLWHAAIKQPADSPVDLPTDSG